MGWSQRICFKIEAWQKNTLENCTSKMKYTFKQTIRFRWVDLKESVSKLKRGKKKMYSRIVLQNWSTLCVPNKIFRVVLQNWITLSYKLLCLDSLISKNAFQNLGVPKNVLENCTSKLKYTSKQTFRFRLVDLKESVPKLKRAKKYT
jgi:glutaredoxin-related protein